MRVPAVFEEEVRKTARHLFPNGGAFGPVILDGRERDGIVNTGENIHIIEATCNPKKDKAKQDLDKSLDLKRKLAPLFPSHNFHIWFITQKDPTADQMAEADACRKRAKCPVTAMSLNSFSQRLVNSSLYLASRQNYPFGSVRHLDPRTPNKFVPEEEFVAIDLIDLESRKIFPSDLSDQIQNNDDITLLVGEYGSGKSMTMRHAFFRAKASFQKNEVYRFPIYLNLRDHIGQDEPSSAIYDHGAKIGFTNPEQLVRAWRAGFTHVFLDGFDEIASSRFRSGVAGLRAVRRRAMTLVRKFIEEHPSEKAGLMISGRQNYFGSIDELLQSLGLKSRSCKLLTLNEFTVEQVGMYLQRIGDPGSKIPDWLPLRPLLIGYLATRGLLDQETPRMDDASQAESWDYLLSRICDREGLQIDELGGQTDLVRDYVDRLATKARSTTSGRGPISVGDMTELFRQIFPSSPDETAQQLLVRLAGITGAAETPSAMTAAAVDMEDSREFVDEDLVDVARAGDVVRFVKHPYNDELNRIFADKNTVIGMGELGIEVALSKLGNVSPGQITTALIYAAEVLEAPTLAMELVRIMQRLKIGPQPTKQGYPIVIRDGYFPYVSMIPDIDFSNVIVRDCIISKIEFDLPVSNISGPKIESCLVQEAYGVLSIKDAPASVLSTDTEVTIFKDEIDTNNDVRRLALPEAVRVLVISLRKLFLQAGGGRKVNAFSRGLDDVEKPYVGDVLAAIASSDYASLSRGVWIPNRLKRNEAFSIIEAPNQLNNPLIEAVKNL